jgi:transcriptional regulator with XRE-family HTH domain
MTKDERTDYGYKLHTLRLAVGLSARELGIACGFTGYTASRTVSYWERGDRLPSIEHIRPLAIALQVPISQVVP